MASPPSYQPQESLGYEMKVLVGPRSSRVASLIFIQKLGLSVQQV